MHKMVNSLLINLLLAIDIDNNINATCMNIMLSFIITGIMNVGFHCFPDSSTCQGESFLMPTSQLCCDVYGGLSYRSVHDGECKPW